MKKHWQSTMRYLLQMIVLRSICFVYTKQPILDLKHSNLIVVAFEVDIRCWKICITVKAALRIHYLMMKTEVFFGKLLPKDGKLQPLNTGI